MRRLLRSSALGLALLLTITALAAGCAYAFPPALVVSGVGSAAPFTLSDSDFQSALTTIAGSKVLTTGLVGEQVDPYSDPSKSAYNPAFVTGVLSVVTNVQLQVATAESLGVKVTEADTSAAKDKIAQSFGGASAGSQTSASTPGDPAAGAAALASLGALGDVLVQYVAIQDGLSKATAPTDQDLRAAYEGAKDRLGERACASHILIGLSTTTDPQSGTPAVPTDAEYAAALAKAQDLEAQLAAGADFAALAKANSEDPGSAAKGGDLGCNEQGKMVAEFDKAMFSQDVGVVGPPVKTQYGYHIIKVTSRGKPSFEDVRDQIVQALAPSATQKVVQAKAKEATVKVDPRYGSWDAAKMQVIPPSGAADPTIPTSTSTLFDPTGSGSSPGGSEPPTADSSTTSTPVEEPPGTATTGTAAPAGSSSTTPAAGGSTTTSSVKPAAATSSTAAVTTTTR